MSTQLHAACQAQGRPVRLHLPPGQPGDCLVAEALLAELPARAVVADKAYDTDQVRAYAAAHRMQAVIPAKRSRKQALPHDLVLTQNSKSAGR